MNMQVLDNADMSSILFRLQNLETAANQMQSVIAQQGQEIKDLKAAAGCPPDWVPAEILKYITEAKLAKEAQDAWLAFDNRRTEEVGALNRREEKEAKEAQEAKQAQEAHEAHEAKQVKEAQEAQEAKAAQKAKQAKIAQDLATMDMVAAQLVGKDIPDIRGVLHGVDKTTVTNTVVRGCNLLECLSEFLGCDPTTPNLVENKWYAMRILLLDYPWTESQVNWAMDKFLPLALTCTNSVVFQNIVEFHLVEPRNKPLVTFDQVKKVVARQNLFAKMSAKNVKLMVSLMDQKKPVSM
jgi:hypothetical protein